MPITLPPLRDRGRDILELAVYFLEDFSKRMNITAPRLTEEVNEALLSYSWPGNVRELRNMMERILILRGRSDNSLRLCDLPAEMLEARRPVIKSGSQKDTEEGLAERLDRIEREMIVEALAKNGGNRTQAANDLGISRFSLIRRLQRHGLD